MQLPLLRFEMARMFGSLVVVGARPCAGPSPWRHPSARIVCVDEIDKGVPPVPGFPGRPTRQTARVFAILNWLSERTRRLSVVAHANDISQLPPELLRKASGRDLFVICRAG